MLTIDKAETAHHFKERYSYPFSEMDVGDSILINDFKQAESARVSAFQYARRKALSWKFSVRKSRDGWRIIRTT